MELLFNCMIRGTNLWLQNEATIQRRIWSIRCGGKKKKENHNDDQQTKENGERKKMGRKTRRKKNEKNKVSLAHL